MPFKKISKLDRLRLSVISGITSTPNCVKHAIKRTNTHDVLSVPNPKTLIVILDCHQSFITNTIGASTNLVIKPSIPVKHLCNPSVELMNVIRSIVPIFSLSHELPQKGVK